MYLDWAPGACTWCGLPGRELIGDVVLCVLDIEDLMAKKISIGDVQRRVLLRELVRLNRKRRK